MTDIDTTLDGATEVMASNMSIIGRDEINDMEAIFNLIGRIDENGYHEVVDTCPAMFTWDYEKGFRPQLDKLYEKAKRSQWNGSTDLERCFHSATLVSFYFSAKALYTSTRRHQAFDGDAAQARLPRVLEVARGDRRDAPHQARPRPARQGAG